MAQAYVTIIPSMKGIQGDIADALDADKVGNDAGKEMGDGISAGLSAKAVVIGNVITDALKAAIGKAIDIGKDIAGGIYDGYAQNEQLVGGMQKLFGDVDYQTVVNNANRAFMTAGVSANDYMSTVTSFSSSLISSLGGDTAEAAHLADMAMQDMSDNINTFGTDADLVQNAVMGIAKGNYSMLDNLSLGFAGNQQGMVDLINASGVLGSKMIETSDLADIGFDTMLKAIHNVQVQTGIAGTTMNEAMGTLEGSSAAASAAWENVLTAIGSGDASQVEAAASGLIDTVFGTVDEESGNREGGLIANLVGLATRAFTALGAALPGLLDMALNALPPEIGGPLREAFDSIGKVVETVAPVVTTAISGIVTAVGTIAPVVAPLLPLIAGAMGAVKIVGVITGIVGAISGFIGTAGAAISMISGLPALIGAVVTLLGGPITIIAAVVGAIVAFIATNEQARNTVVNVFDTIKTTITNAFNAVKAVVGTVVSTIVNNVKGKFSALVGTVRTIFNNVKNAITNPINTAKTTISNAIGRIKSIINGAKLQLPHFKLPHFNISGGKLPWGIGGKGTKPSISVSWYARGGWIEDATLIGAGEKGGELIWPGYAPYLDRYAEAIAAHLPDGTGDNSTTVYVNGNVNDAPQIRAVTKDYLLELARLGAI